MEEQEGKTWKGTASDLYNRLKEIIGEATGAEPTDEQLASTLRTFGIEITRHKRSGGSPHLKISARPDSARRIAPIAPNAPNAAAAAKDRVPRSGVRALRSTRLPAGRAGTFRLPRWAA